MDNIGLRSPKLHTKKWFDKFYFQPDSIYGFSTLNKNIWKFAASYWKVKDVKFVKFTLYFYLYDAEIWNV